MAPAILSNSLILSNAEIINGKSVNYASDRFDQSAKSSASEPTKLPKHKPQKPYFRFDWQDIVWRNIVIFAVLHASAAYGLYLLVFGRAKLATFIMCYSYGTLGGMGITAGAHRLWAHRSYKATWQLRLILIIVNLIAFQNSVYEWVRDHRLHHKFTDSDADPHNSQRGFFFSHMGWLLVRKHADIKRKGACLDMSDLESDRLVMFQKKYYGILMPSFCFIIPTLMPYYILNESLSSSWFVASALRYVLTLHATWLVNSVAHIWGWKPYDKTIAPTNNPLVSLAAFGEGWHNYHHVFPWDYKTSELGGYSLNMTTGFIDFFARIGWAYDLKTVSDDIIRKRAKRTGDGTTHFSRCIQAPDNGSAECDDKSESKTGQASPAGECLIWGWDDADMDTDEKKHAIIINNL